MKKASITAELDWTGWSKTERKRIETIIGQHPDNYTDLVPFFQVAGRERKSLDVIEVWFRFGTDVNKTIANVRRVLALRETV